MRSLGIDIGGSSVKAAIRSDETVMTARSPGYFQPSREALSTAVGQVIQELGPDIDQSVPVGLCLPGKQSASGDRVEYAINMPCLNDWAFSDMLQDMLGFMPLQHRVVSDIHATATDLVSVNKLEGRVAIIAIGTGVGFAMMEHGHFIGIGSGGAGFLGQLDVGRCGNEDRFHSDGSKNTLESYVGIRAMREQLGTDDENAIVEYIDAMGEDSPFLRAIVQAMRVVHAIHVPDTIVLAGGIGIAMHSFSDEIHTLVSDRLTTLSNSSWKLVFGDTLFHAASGAARLAAM